MEIKKATTIHDIARALDLNSSTVSRALNDHPRVSSKTKEKIKAKAKELDYQPNHLAANLRTSKSKTIGVIIPHISRYFFSTVIAGIEDIAQQQGYNVIICQSKDETQKEINSVEALLKSRVDGIIISPAMQDREFDHLQKALDQHIPVFFFDRYAESLETTKVIMDDLKTAEKLCDHLLEQGARKILVLSGPESASIYRNRILGIKESFRKNDYDINEHLSILNTDLKTEPAYLAVKKWLEKKAVPDAIYALNDMAAFGAIKALKEKRIQIPGEVMVVGFSNEPVSELITPSLTTVNQPAYEMGKLVTRKILLQIEEKVASYLSETAILKSEIIIRESSRKVK
ncbi:LacI family DNA-binding transcriptional regulator [Persicobacter diffluens]|uniref:LacI family transcriptional regulator n=1 Tax=Persicobacter diffluens TaxID=981 RepID=A0AAN5AQD9_9BACT|nr:LacI family transcriptional regulator [Persicobacter diffluens]